MFGDLGVIMELARKHVELEYNQETELKLPKLQMEKFHVKENLEKLKNVLFDFAQSLVLGVVGETTVPALLLVLLELLLKPDLLLKSL